MVPRDLGRPELLNSVMIREYLAYGVLEAELACEKRGLAIPFYVYYCRSYASAPCIWDGVEIRRILHHAVSSIGLMLYRITTAHATTPRPSYPMFQHRAHGPGRSGDREAHTNTT